MSRFFVILFSTLTTLCATFYFLFLFLQHHFHHQHQHQHQTDTLLIKYKNYFLLHPDDFSSSSTKQPLIISSHHHHQNNYYHCNVYKNETITKNLNQLSFPKASLIIPPNQRRLSIFYYGRAAADDNNWIINNFVDFIEQNKIVDSLVKILQQDNSLQFIDIGSNLGLYSLTAASLGRKVIAVEAMEENCQRNYASILANHFENQIVLVQNVLSDFRGNVSIRKNPMDNFEMEQQMLNIKEEWSMTMDSFAFFTTIQSIFMDDLLKVITFERGIMKMNIDETTEDYQTILSHANELFNQIDIPIVLFKWTRQGDNPGDVIYFFLSKGYCPFSSLSKRTPDLKPNDYDKWPVNIVWKKQPYLYA